MQATQPAFFRQGPKPLTRLLIFSVISLAMIVGDAHFKMLDRVREKVSVVLYPLQWLATEPFEIARTTTQFFSRQAELLAENRRLNDAQLVAQAQAMKMKALEAENLRLRQLDERQASFGSPSQLVEILYNGRDPFTARLIVDRGERAGIAPGQAVIDTVGVVGQIIRIQPLTSEVRMITDRDQMVPVMVERNQLRTVIYGMGRNQPLEVRNMAPNVDIKEGDRLVTSGIDGIYPAGLAVARVLRIDRSASSAFARIVCAPLADVDQHRFLLVLNTARVLPPYPVTPTPTPDKKKRGR
ncbi:rod shape-determining protein MreC [Amantichitinum ursilacus]|uniref:Cell shape-determining protein MreC n=1 Tax=Amantichitinum ursilacus TaxID=857265 RepID=A0A0N1JT01_9NEIS|nr:rod shape-determining protein MreC [Amantichitinum ursilacus]KPC53398.1 Cell shape-determining protein MreC [Amantichitinum ursilacus]